MRSAIVTLLLGMLAKPVFALPMFTLAEAPGPNGERIVTGIIGLPVLDMTLDVEFAAWGASKASSAYLDTFGPANRSRIPFFWRDAEDAASAAEAITDLINDQPNSFVDEFLSFGTLERFTTQMDEDNRARLHVLWDVPIATGIIVVASTEVRSNGAVAVPVTTESSFAGDPRAAYVLFSVPEPSSCSPANELLGDLDGDGSVNFRDFLALAVNFGNDVDRYADGDVNCDRTVEFGDFLILSAHFGPSTRCRECLGPRAHCDGATGCGRHHEPSDPATN